MLDYILFLIRFLSEELHVKILLILRTLGFNVVAQTRTAKGTIVSKTSGTVVTLPDVSMIGGDSLVVAIAWDTGEAANPDVTYGGRDVGDFLEGVTLPSGWRLRVVHDIINNTREADVKITWPASVVAKVAVVTSLSEAGLANITNDGTNLATTISTTGARRDADHIQTVHMGWHMTNGPASDAIGSSSTGHTLGQRAGTTGGVDTTNVTLQETYRIETPTTVLATAITVGLVYQIKTIGTTDFTLIGAASNTVGLQFEATAVGTGTGDAYELADLRSRLTGLATRDHGGVMGFFRPKQTFTIKRMEQIHRNQNHNPDWVWIEVEDENGQGFEFPIDPDLYDDWSDAVVNDYVSKIASIWVRNIIDSNLSYEADTDRDTRMATFVNDQIIL